MARLKAFLVVPKVSTGHIASIMAIWEVMVAKPSAGTRRLTMPQSRASSAEIGRLLKMNSVARPSPIRAGSSRETPESGTSPIPVNPTVNFALSAAIRKSQASAIPNPAPATVPLIAAMTGFSISLIFKMRGL